MTIAKVQKEEEDFEKKKSMKKHWREVAASVLKYVWDKAIAMWALKVVLFTVV